MKQFRFIILLALFSLTACLKEKDNAAPVKKEGTQYTLTGVISEKTRALISEAGAFSWEAGDRVAVLDANTGDLCEFVCNDGDGEFTFTGEPNREYNFTKAWYPAALAVSEDVISFPATWSHTDLAQARQFPMAASISDGKMPFYHLGGLIKVSINQVPANATSLILSSQDVALSGNFAITHLGLDDGRVDARGEQVVVENEDIEVKSVPEVDAASGAGTVTIGLNLDQKQNLTLYVPLPCGNYRYKVSLKVEDTPILERETSAAKVIDRAVLVKMSALTVSWPATALQARYDDVTVDFGPSDLWGWFKVEGLPAGKDIRIVNSGTSTQYGAKHSTQKRVGYLVQCLSGGSARTFPLRQNSDLYMAEDCTKFFLLAAGTSGSSIAVPSEYEVAHFGLRGNFDGTEYKTVGSFTRANDKAPVDGWGWYAVRNVLCAIENIEFKLYANAPYASQGLVVTSTTTRQNAGIGRSLSWSENGQYAIAYRVIPGCYYDFYLREDLQQVFVYESGSQGAMDEERILGLSQYGLYYYSNSSWVYNPGRDQFWITGTSPATFVMVDGTTFDQVQVENLPANPLVGDQPTVTITVTPTIGSVKSSSIQADVVKVEGDKVWLLTSDGTGMIVSVQ